MKITITSSMPSYSLKITLTNPITGVKDIDMEALKEPARIVRLTPRMFKEAILITLLEGEYDISGLHFAGENA